MEDASERAVVVDLPDAWMRRAALEPQREVDPAILRRETDRARAHLEDDPAALRIDGHRTELTDAVAQEPIQGKDLCRPIAKVRRRAHPPAGMRHVSCAEGATAFRATPKRTSARSRCGLGSL